MSYVSSTELLTAAREIIEKGNEIEEHPDCPLCAIAWAKSEYDNAHGTGCDSELAVRDMLRNEVTEVDSDAPLIEARKRLKPFIPPECVFTKEISLRILDRAIGV